MSAKQAGFAILASLAIAACGCSKPAPAAPPVKTVAAVAGSDAFEREQDVNDKWSSATVAMPVRDKILDACMFEVPRVMASIDARHGRQVRSARLVYPGSANDRDDIENEIVKAYKIACEDIEGYAGMGAKSRRVVFSVYTMEEGTKIGNQVCESITDSDADGGMPLMPTVEWMK